MRGLHLTFELHECEPVHRPLLRDAAALRELCLRSVARHGLQAVGELFHPFAAPGGVTGVVLLAESHLALHTWPELASVTLDVYVCNASGDHGAQAEALCDELCRAFTPRHITANRLHRGAIAPP